MRELISFYAKVLKNPIQNIPSIFFLGVALFGLLTLFSLIVTDILTFPFILIATIASFIAMWYIKILGTLSENLEKMEQNIDKLKESNDKLHNELKAMQALRESLEAYAKENNSSLKKVIEDINNSFKKLEEITKENERVLLYKIAQDLEFMDRKAGMSKEEYDRFIKRVPEYLKGEFKSFYEVARDDNKIDYKELEGVIKSILENRKVA
jgi:biopolymer transport protein ExbB/TolQ